MNEAASDDAEIPLRGEPKPPFCWVGNEVFDIWLPIMGADCLTLYELFARRVYFDPRLRHTVRDLADATGVGVSTVSRSLEILEHLRLVKVTRFGGSKNSECRLLDSLAVANRLGAIYDPGTHSYSLPPEVTMRLKAEVKALREKQQGKMSSIALNGAPLDCGNLTSPVSQRNTSVSLAIRERSTRETQTGTHLLLEERRIENVLSPTPSHDCQAQHPKNLSNKDEPDELAQWARDKFTGVMKDMGSHLLDTNRPLNSHLANGFADWQEFELNSLAVKAAERRGEVLALVLSATDPAAARRGLVKYLRAWNAALRKWYKCEVYVELQQAQRKW